MSIEVNERISFEIDDKIKELKSKIKPKVDIGDLNQHLLE